MIQQKDTIRGKRINSVLAGCSIIAVLILQVAAPQTGQCYARLVMPQATQTLVEDFTSDTNPSTAAFASSTFVHTTSGSYSLVDGIDLPQIIPFPSPPHAMFRFSGSDQVSFILNAGDSVTRAKVWVNSFFGEGNVTFVGATNSRTFLFSQGRSSLAIGRDAQHRCRRRRLPDWRDTEDHARRIRSFIRRC